MAKGKKSKASGEKTSKEDVTEIFDVKKKGGNTEHKVAHGKVEGVVEKKGEGEKYNQILRNILIGIGVIILLVVLWAIISYNMIHFSYRGVDFEKVEELAPYKTSFPVIIEGKKLDYNIYIRNDPRVLDKDVPFEGEMDFGSPFNDGSHRLVLNMSGEFDCGGHEVISIANMVKLEALGIKVVKDPNANCDSKGRYMFANVVEGETSEIRQIGNACYELSVSNCEILAVTERFMTESFVEYYELAKIFE